MSNITNNKYTYWNNKKKMGGRRVSQIYRVYHLTEQSNNESVLDKPKGE
jgi:hypothetical protein